MDTPNFSQLLYFNFWVKVIVKYIICHKIERMIKRFIGYRDRRVGTLVSFTVLCVIEYILLRWGSVEAWWALDMDTARLERLEKRLTETRVEGFV